MDDLTMQRCFDEYRSAAEKAGELRMRIEVLRSALAAVTVFGNPHNLRTEVHELLESAEKKYNAAVIKEVICLFELRNMWRRKEIDAQ